MSAILQAFGFEPTRDNGAAQTAVNQANDSNSLALSAWNRANRNNQDLSTSLANTNYMAGAQNVYNQQQNAASMLYNQAAGNAPSAAQLQMQAGLANANNQVQSAALANQGGMNPGATQRNLLAAQAQQNAAITSAGMANRAAEQAQQQQAYNSVLANMQGQQQNMGAFNYQQGQGNLNYQTLQAQNAMNNNVNRNQMNVGNTIGNINSAAQANAAQASALGQTISSGAGMLAKAFA